MKTLILQGEAGGVVLSAENLQRIVKNLPNNLLALTMALVGYCWYCMCSCMYIAASTSVWVNVGISWFSMLSMLYCIHTMCTIVLLQKQKRHEFLMEVFPFVLNPIVGFTCAEWFVGCLQIWEATEAVFSGPLPFGVFFLFYYIYPTK